MMRYGVFRYGSMWPGKTAYFYDGYNTGFKLAEKRFSPDFWKRILANEPNLKVVLVYDESTKFMDGNGKKVIEYRQRLTQD